ncbi:MAG: CPBP family intramembrane metalloprotease [Bryobacterales bacterium]|nr:CPBP family intramembrane metalloprotease [Bryobacterales bacterium]
MKAARAKFNPDQLRFLVRVSVFIALAVVGRLVFPIFLDPLGNLLMVSALSTFMTAAVANLVVVRGWENGKAADCGMGWLAGSGRDLAYGLAGGAGGAALIVSVALALRMAAFDVVPGLERLWANIPFLLVVLLFGAVGEELLFHGYGFQALARNLGAFATVLPVGVLFGWAHTGNPGVTGLAIFNTIGWGVLLGCAFLRTQALWLPIGLHFGWNAAMPFLGVNLSGFTMGMTGYRLRWSVGGLWSGGAYGLEGSLFTTLTVAALFVLLYRVVPGAPDR